MTSDRIQRHVERLLDEAEDAADQEKWSRVADLAGRVLAIDEHNADAVALMKMADGGGSAPTTTPERGPSAPSAPQHPDSFAGGRYRVERFFGEGAKKRVFLAHDTTLDRDVAFGQFRTEGMDAAGAPESRRRRRRWAVGARPEPR